MCSRLFGDGDVLAKQRSESIKIMNRSPHAMFQSNTVESGLADVLARSRSESIRIMNRSPHAMLQTNSL